jgi:hypothetical protein
MQRIKYFGIIVAITMFTLFLSSCYEIKNIEQPQTAEKNSEFDVSIEIELTAQQDTAIGNFAIKVPEGWTVDDSIQYTGVLNGTFVYSESYSDSISTESGYTWWGYATTDSIESLPDGLISFTLTIHTNDTTGFFYIDYAISHNNAIPHKSMTYYKSCPISIDAPSYLEVTSLNDDGPGSLRECLSKIGNGGGISFASSLSGTIYTNSTINIDRNVTINGPGMDILTIDARNDHKGIYLQADMNLNVTIKDLTVSRGYSSAGGGGIDNDAKQLYLERIALKNNHAGYGAGLQSNRSFCSVHMTDCILMNNTANDGGGISIGGTLYLDNCLLIENHANEGGGLNTIFSNVTLTRTQLINNYAQKGGSIHANSSDLTIINSTISDSNTSIIDVCIIDSSKLKLLNSILWKTNSDKLEIDWSENNTAIIAYCNIADSTLSWFSSKDTANVWLERNISQDPLFVDPDSGNYTLQSGSPCIDAGIDYYIHEDDTIIVCFSELDYIGDAPDIGAFEYGMPVVTIEGDILPKICTLYQNYPNPLNPTTTISYQLSADSDVELTIYDIAGRKIKTLIKEYQPTGYHSVNWNASSFPSGIYLYRLKAGNFIETKKMVLLK